MKIDHDAPERLCTGHCGRVLPRETFTWADKEQTRRRGDCPKCEYDKHKKRINSNRQFYLHRQRVANLKHKYNLSYEDWLALYEAQNGLCPICSMPVDIRSAIDHDHDCCGAASSCGQCVRGILHNQCNVGLANFRESIPRLRAAIAYLEKGTEPSES